ncbi:15-hydroxyprostaglandin dehydrogenase [Trichonephila clavipes]|nr:15-hydroxyprostaglandin dehydrogenase [Trichonephila clavipes]
MGRWKLGDQLGEYLVHLGFPARKESRRENIFESDEIANEDTLCCPEADGPTNLEQPTLNYVQSDTMASTVVADPTCALQGTNRGCGLAMEESENDVGSLQQLLLYPNEQ